MLYNETLIRVHVKINPKLVYGNMNCYYLIAVDCLRVALRKIQHDSCSYIFK